MVEDYYICLDDKALRYAQKHFNNKFARIMRCYTNYEVDIVVTTINKNKGKSFYTLRCAQRSILRTEIKSLDILAKVIDRADA